MLIGKTCSRCNRTVAMHEERDDNIAPGPAIHTGFAEYTCRDCATPAEIEAITRGRTERVRVIG